MRFNVGLIAVTRRGSVVGVFSERDLLKAVTQKVRPPGRGHNYILGHNYMGHNYMGHNYVGHTYVGHSYVGHSYLGRSIRPMPTWAVII